MASLEIYEKLKGEINRLFEDGDCLMEKDEFVLDLITKSGNGKDVLRLVKELKEKGNSLFKQKKVDDALEQYGYAGVILGRFAFVKEEDRVEFFELAICLLSNCVACLSRKKEFDQVGQICSVILDFNPNNIKALFRRAMAAIELGRRDLAYWDLLMAVEVDPDNQEVVKKLEEIKSILYQQKQKINSQDDVPAGLGIGLAPPRNMPKKSLVKEDRIAQDESYEEDPTTNMSEDKSVTDSGLNEKEADGYLEDFKPQGCPSANELTMNERVEEAKEVLMDDVEKVKSKLVEPKIRFSNRRRPGSSISISKKDYHELVRGKSICCYNSRTGSRLSIRVVSISREDQSKKELGIQENRAESTLGNHSQQSRVNNAFAMESKVQRTDNSIAMKFNLSDSRIEEQENATRSSAYQSWKWRSSYEIKQKMKKIRRGKKDARRKQRVKPLVTSTTYTIDVCR